MTVRVEFNGDNDYLMMRGAGEARRNPDNAVEGQGATVHDAVPARFETRMRDAYNQVNARGKTMAYLFDRYNIFPLIDESNFRRDKLLHILLSKDAPRRPE